MSFIIGLGTSSERLGDPAHAAFLPVALAGAAAFAARADTGSGGACTDVVALVRPFDVSGL